MNELSEQSAETETARQLYTLEIMCRHFGWNIPACYINAARMELLDMAATNAEKVRHIA